MYVDGKPLTPAPLDLRVEQRLGHHTIMHTHVQYPWQAATDPVMIEEDSLVHVRWGSKPSDLIDWYGYVHHATYDSRMAEDSRQVKIAYTLIGTGHILADARTKAWKNITDSGMATKIAQQFGLGSVVHKTTKIHKYLYQHGISDYAWLQERGHATGRKMWVENGCLYFVDIAAWAAARSSMAPEFEIHKDYARPTDNFRLQVDMGTDMPQTGRQLNRQIYGVDHKTGRFVERHKRDSQAARTRVLNQPYIDAVDDLNFNLDGYSASGQEWAGAQADLMGSTRLSPGQPITIKGRAVPKHLRGDWMVVTATHHLTAPAVSGVGYAKYVSNVGLARNARDNYRYSDQTVLTQDDRCTAGGGSWRAASPRQVTL
jgi:hypothetical protein